MMLPVTMCPIVIAGLKWPPLMGAPIQVRTVRRKKFMHPFIIIEVLMEMFGRLIYPLAGPGPVVFQNL